MNGKFRGFSEVFKIKCLPNTSPDSGSDPGNVTLIVVSNLRNKQAVNPFEPRASILTLDAVKTYIEQYISPFIRYTPSFRSTKRYW